MARLLCLACVICLPVFSALAQDQPKAPESAGDEVFETENFKLKSPVGALVKWSDDVARPKEYEAVTYSACGSNAVNALILRHPKKRDADVYGMVAKDPGETATGVQWAEFGRLSDEKPTSTKEERRKFLDDLLKPSEIDGVKYASAASADLDPKRLNEAIWNDEATPPRVFLYGRDERPGYFDLKPGEQIEWDEKTGKMKGWYEHEHLMCVSMNALFFHAKGVYQARGWGFVIKNQGRPELEQQMKALFASFELKQSTTFHDDAGYTFDLPFECARSRKRGLNTSLSLKAKKQRDYRESGPPFIQVGYEASLGIAPEGGPYLQAREIDSLSERLQKGLAKTKREKDTMNFITSSRVDKKPRKVKYGDKKKGTELEAQQFEATYSWTTLHQTGTPGQFHTVNENMAVILTAVSTKRGLLLVMTRSRAEEAAWAKTTHDALMQSLKIAEANKPEETPKDK